MGRNSGSRCRVDARTGHEVTADQGWDQRYRGEDYLFGTEPAAFLVREAGRFEAGQRVLCVADGEGRNSAWLASRGLVVDAFDPSPVAVGKAERLARERGVDVGFAVAGVDDYAWPLASVDGVVAVFVQFAPPEQRRVMFRRMRDALVPGGTLLLHGYRVEQLEYGTGGPPIASHLYTEGQLRAELDGLEIESVREYDAVVREGTGHVGMSALIDVVATRTVGP